MPKNVHTTLVRRFLVLTRLKAIFILNSALKFLIKINSDDKNEILFITVKSPNESEYCMIF